MISMIREVARWAIIIVMVLAVLSGELGIAILMILTVIAMDVEKVGQHQEITNDLLAEMLIIADPSVLDEACDGECENCMCDKFDKEI
jgi:hypothetical protein